MGEDKDLKAWVCDGFMKEPGRDIGAHTLLAALKDDCPDLPSLLQLFVQALINVYLRPIHPEWDDLPVLPAYMKLGFAIKL